MKKNKMTPTKPTQPTKSNETQTFVLNFQKKKKFIFFTSFLFRPPFCSSSSSFLVRNHVNDILTLDFFPIFN